MSNVNVYIEGYNCGQAIECITVKDVNGNKFEDISTKYLSSITFENKLSETAKVYFYSSGANKISDSGKISDFCWSFFGPGVPTAPLEITSGSVVGCTMRYGKTFKPIEEYVYRIEAKDYGELDPVIIIKPFFSKDSIVAGFTGAIVIIFGLTYLWNKRKNRQKTISKNNEQKIE